MPERDCNDRSGSPQVLRIITRLNIGGPARQALFLHRALGERGFCSELVSGTEGPSEGAFPPPPDGFTRVAQLKRATGPIADLRALKALIRIMRAKRPDIVHTHTATAGGLGRLAARRAQVPIVVHTFHGHVLSGYLSSPQSAALAAAERFLARRTDALVSVSEQVRDELLSFGIGQPSQWHVIPLGLELDELLRSTMPAPQARAALGLPLEGRVVGMVGRLARIKDHRTFLDAARRVAQKLPDTVFVIAGGGELREHLETRAGEMLGERVRFLGWVTDLPVLYSGLDVVVLTSRNEGTPVALIEAGAAGRPVVATRVGGVPEVVKDGRTGLLASPGDSEGIAAHIIRLLEDEREAQGMGAEGREWVRERFSAARLVNDFVSLYTELLARKGIPVGSDDR